MKKFLALLLAASMLLICFAGCADTGVSDNPDDSEDSEKGNALNRIKKVTVTYEGETIVCNATWEDNVCNFESYMNYFKDPIEDYKGVFDPESKKFSILWPSKEIELPVFRYDDQQRIIEVYNEDDPSESWAVTYDENGVPTLDGDIEMFNYDADNKIVSLQGGGGSSNKDGVITESKYYSEMKMSPDGNFEKVTHVTYSHNGDGNFQKTSEIPDYEKYTYDKNGNLVRYERHDGSCVIEFEYYDEPIQHIWERTIPIHYIDIFDIYTTSLMWYLK